MKIVVLGDVHRFDLHRIFIPIVSKWLDGNDRNVCGQINDNCLVYQFPAKLWGNSTKRDKQLDERCINGLVKLVDLGVVLGRAIGITDFCILRGLYPVAALPSMLLNRCTLLHLVCRCASQS